MQKSLFLKIDRNSTIQPHEIDKDGNAAVSIAFKGDIAENLSGPKKAINVTTNVMNNTIRSNIVVGGVKKIFIISILTFIFTPTLQLYFQPIQ